MSVPFIQFNPTNTPYSTGAAGGYTQASIQATLPLMPQEKIQLYEQRNQKPPITVLLDLFGYKGIVAGPQNGHYESAGPNSLVKFGTLVSGGAAPGATGVYNISADSTFSFTPPGSSTAVTGYTFVEGEIIELKTAGRPKVQIGTINFSLNRVTLIPCDATTQLSTSIVPGEFYSITGSAYADASGIPASKAERIFAFNNTFQLLKTAAGSSGRGLATQTYFQPLGGANVPMLERELKLAMARHEEQCAMTLYTGKQIDNINANANNFVNYSLPVTGTLGAIPYMETYAQQDSYNIGSYTIEDFIDVTSYLNGQRPHSSNYMCIQGDTAGVETWRAISNFSQGFSASGLDVITTSGQTISLDNIKSVTNIPGSNFTFNFYIEQLFSDSRGLGIAGYPYRNLNMFVPLGTTTDAVTRNPTTMFGYDVMGLNGYVRENVVQREDGTGYTDITNLSIDFHRAYIFTDMAGHYACPNQMVLQKGV